MLKLLTATLARFDGDFWRLTGEACSLTGKWNNSINKYISDWVFPAFYIALIRLLCHRFTVQSSVPCAVFWSPFSPPSSAFSKNWSVLKVRQFSLLRLISCLQLYFTHCSECKCCAGLINTCPPIREEELTHRSIALAPNRNLFQVYFCIHSYPAKPFLFVQLTSQLLVESATFPWLLISARESGKKWTGLCFLINLGDPFNSCE